MAQKFSTLEEAADQLGISKERLTELREAGKVRGYRDGASWKFRADDVAKLASEGIPTIEPPPSDLALDLDIGGDSGSSLSVATASPSGVDLELSDLTISNELAASDIVLDNIDEPTATVSTDVDEAHALDADDELLDLSDSILLSESALGGAANRPPSTIIGKADLDPDLDLTLSGDSGSAALSDVKLATTSDVLVGADEDSVDILPAGSADSFKGLAELDVDLEGQASGSKVLTDSGAGKVRAAAQAQQAPSSGDLQLAADSDAARASSDIGLAGGSSGGPGLTGLSALDVEEDEQVLAEGSDITLSSSSSGINIISPSDSGLALDEVPLSSASMSSPLDLGSAIGADEVALEPLELSDDMEEGEEPFQLTPLGEADEDEKDSSQVIALDEISEEVGGVMFEPEEEGAVLSDDFAVAGLAPGVMPAATAAADDMAFDGWVMGGLALSFLFMLVCGAMMFDLVRNMWAWDGVGSINSTLMDVLKPMIGG